MKIMKEKEFDVIFSSLKKIKVGPSIPIILYSEKEVDEFYKNYKLEN